jgi:hypothetical protein
MAISTQQAVERALRQIRKQTGKVSREEATLWRSTLSVIAGDALDLMAKRVAAGPAYEGLQTDYSVNTVAGFIDLRALTGILFDIDRARVRVTSTNATVRAVDSYETLENGGLQPDQIYYAQDGTGLRFRDLTGSITAYAVAVKIMANYIPSFTDAALPIPTQYEPALVSTMVELALGQMQPAEAKETTEIAGRA